MYPQTTSASVVMGIAYSTLATRCGPTVSLSPAAAQPVPTVKMHSV
jgi:hypothetical protein